MVFPGRYLRGTRNPKQGEIALTLAVLSVMMMIIGTIAGIGVTRTQDPRSRAASLYCGLPCEFNNDCGRDSASGSQTVCNVSQPKGSPGRVCVSASGFGMESNPKCPTGLKTCGEGCTADRDCNAPLTCNRTTKVCGGAACPTAKPTVFSERITPGSGGTPAGGGGTGGGLPTPVPTGGIGGSTIGTAFRVTSLACKVEFTFQWDPQLISLKITDPNNPRNVFVANNNMVTRTDPTSCTFGPIGKQITFPSGGTAGIFVTVDPRTSNEILVTLNGGGGGLCSVVRYYIPFPSWMNGSVDYKVDIEYEGKVAGVVHRWSQTGSTRACTSITQPVQSPTPTLRIGAMCGTACGTVGGSDFANCPQSPQRLECRALPGARNGDFKYCLLPAPNDDFNCRSTTVTPSIPTPRVTRCGGECTSTAECPLNLGGPPIVCRQKVGATPSDSKKYCLLPAPNDDPQCRVVTPSIPSPSPSRITPSVPTPTIPICRKSIYFMIDSSSTQTNNITNITRPLNDFFRGKQFKNVRFHYDTFNVIAPREQGSGNETIQFGITNGQNWTNINAAFDVMKGRKDGARIFISDGIPSVLEPAGNVRSATTSETLVCTYKENGTVTSGCSPVWDTPGRTDNHRPEDQCKDPNIFGANFNKYCTEPYPVSSSNATHAVVLGGGEGSNRSVIDKSGAPASQIYQGIDALVTQLPNIIATAPCDPAGSSPELSRPRTFMSSFTIQNQSSKAVKSINVKTCNQAGGSCENFLNNIGVQPRSTGRFSQIIPNTVSEANRAVVTCDVNYTDGSSLPCPRKQTQNESVQFNLTVNNRAVSGTAQTFLQAADVNKDGRINGIDYVLCQKQIATTGRKSCDIVSDDLVNAQDISVVTERLGQLAQ